LFLLTAPDFVTISSIRVFHPPQPGQRPNQQALSRPHSRQKNFVFVLDNRRPPVSLFCLFIHSIRSQYFSKAFLFPARFP
jgi:hypothetical protein